MSSPIDSPYGTDYITVGLLNKLLNPIACPVPLKGCPLFLICYAMIRIREQRALNQAFIRIPLHNVEDNQSEIYVGATARNFKDRLNKHRDNIIKGNLVIALAQRAFEKDININWQNAKIVKNIDNCKELLLREKLEIIKSNKHNNVINVRQANELNLA